MYIKHVGSLLPDAYFDVDIDDDRHLVIVLAKPFDSALLGQVVTVVLPRDYGVVAFNDDNVFGLGRGRALYDLQLQFDGLQFDAVVTKTLSFLHLGVTVGLRLSRSC